jgi:hypothetical protein
MSQNVRAYTRHQIDAKDVPMLANYCGPHGKLNPQSFLCDCDEGHVRVYGGYEDSNVGCRPSKGANDRGAVNGHDDGAPGESRADATNCLESQWQTDYKYQLKYGHLWWHAQLLLYMFTGAPKFSVLQDYSRKMLGDTPSCIGVHIRRGDSCNDGSSSYKKCPGNEAYVQHVKALMGVYGSRTHVYLATDDDAVTARLRAEHPEYKWVSQVSDYLLFIGYVIVIYYYCYYYYYYCYY